MALYSYHKKPTGATKHLLTYVSYTTMTIGALFLFWSFYPIVASELYSTFFIQNDVVAPIPGSFESTTVEKARSIKNGDEAYSTNLVDYTQASSWFTNAPSQNINAYSSDIKEYTLSIPKLNIDNVRVVVGGDNLLEGLIQYLPENPPGIEGTVNIFGHSTHPSLYKKKEYQSNFTFIPSLEVGDIFYVTVDSVRYTYEIYDRVVIKPSDIGALQPKYDNSYVNLYTCVPVGTFNSRLQIKARLKEIPAL